MTTPEQSARSRIDVLLTTAGWAVQDAAAANIHAVRGVAIREFPLPFSDQSTGVETRFTNGLDPAPRSRPVFAFHKLKGRDLLLDLDAHGGGRILSRSTSPMASSHC